MEEEINNMNLSIPKAKISIGEELMND